MRMASRVIITWLTALTVLFIILLRKLPSPQPEMPEIPVKHEAKPREDLDSASLEKIKNETLGFEKIFVINLPSRTDHRDAMALAGSFTGLELEWADGVLGNTITDNARPFTEGSSKKLSPSELGAWRAHVNVLERIVERNIKTALILEGDADWDIRLKEQMNRIAQSTRALTQPLKNREDEQYYDTTLIDPSKNDGFRPIHFDMLPETREPSLSPYGDNWDFIWLGHCAQRVPALADTNNAKQRAEMQAVPRGHVTYEDMTAPEPQFRHNYNDDDIMPFKSYPGSGSAGKHTRVVHHSMDGICTSAYAISQRGARTLLFNSGIEAREEPIDFMIQRFCGSDPVQKASEYEKSPELAKILQERERNICLTVQPPLFGQVKLKGAANRQTDITKGILGRLRGWGKDLDKSFTANIRQSTRLNLGKLVRGETDYVDQWPDEKSDETKTPVI